MYSLLLFFQVCHWPLLQTILYFIYFLYSFFIYRYTIGCLLAPAVVGTFGPTRSMIGSASLVCIFIAAHFHPSWGSLIPASAMVGLGCAFMWAAQGVYITRIAVQYAESTNADNSFGKIYLARLFLILLIPFDWPLTH